MATLLRAFLPYPTGPGDVRKWLYNSVSPNAFNPLKGGFTANGFLDFLKDAGLGIRRTDFLKIRRDILGYERFEESIKNLKPQTRIPRAWFNNPTEFEMSKDFQYRFKVTGTDPITGKDIEQVFSWGSDIEVSVEVAEAQITSLIVDEEEFYDLRLHSVDVIQGWVKEGAFDR